MPINWSVVKPPLKQQQKLLAIAIKAHRKESNIMFGIDSLISQYRELLRLSHNNMQDAMECYASLSQIYALKAAHLKDIPHQGEMVHVKYKAAIDLSKSLIKHHDIYKKQSGMGGFVDSGIHLMNGFTSPRYDSRTRSYYALQVGYLFTLKFERCEYLEKQALKAQQAYHAPQPARVLHGRQSEPSLAAIREENVETPAAERQARSERLPKRAAQ